jgi:hypothetical protein
VLHLFAFPRRSVLAPIRCICANFERFLVLASTFWEPSGFISGRMKHDMRPLAPPPPVTSPVTVLQCPSVLQLNPVPLADLYAHKGEDAAGETVCRALEDLAERLNRLVLKHGEVPLDELVTPASRIAAVADQIGLVEVAAAGRHVANSASLDNDVALHATIARLERAFEVAVSQIWTHQDMI